MPILYGFHRYSVSADQGVEAAARLSFDALTSSQREFFHTTLPPLLQATGIGAVRESTLPVIARRWMRIDPACGVKMATADHDYNPYKALEDYLRPYIGVTSNVYFESDSEFNSRIPEYGPPFRASDVTKEQRAKRIPLAQGNIA